MDVHKCGTGAYEPSSLAVYDSYIITCEYVQLGMEGTAPGVNPDNWRGYSKTRGALSGLLSADTSYTGAYSAKLHGQGDQYIESYKPTMTLIQNTTYFMQLRVCGASSNGTVDQYIYSAFYAYPAEQLQPGGRPLEVVATSEESGWRAQHHLETARNHTWQAFMHTLTPSKTYTNVRIRLGAVFNKPGEAYNIYVDGVSISPRPTPLAHPAEDYMSAVHQLYDTIINS
ncbi:hypothetical protein CYMTET_52605 [Cymbomonas tetramitiformis]|uniref:Uncharacterized protein n=1 Tax=Cymbomonas tetramitiformis TaxID=36881 RepID=A0AAE0BIP4_9CHLO|nr:hypothetical protein CYMTET_52605 [Cymbomonas tetramitiformis]